MSVDPRRIAAAILSAFELGEHAAVVDLVHALGSFTAVASPLYLIGAISAYESGDDLQARAWFDIGSSAIDDDPDARALLKKAREWIDDGRWSRRTSDRLRGQIDMWRPQLPPQTHGKRL